MSKLLKTISISAVILIVIGFVALTLIIDSLVKSGIEQVGSEMTGTNVTVERVSISPFSGKGTIHGFKVANPEDFEKEHLLIFESLEVSVNITSILSDEIIIEELIVKGPEIYVIQKLPENNLAMVMSNIQSVEANQTTEKTMVVNRFLMEKGAAELYTDIGGERTERVELDSIELNDLGKGGGRNAVENVIQDIAGQIAEKGLQAAARSGGEQLRDAIRNLFD